MKPASGLEAQEKRKTKGKRGFCLRTMGLKNRETVFNAAEEKPTGRRGLQFSWESQEKKMPALDQSLQSYPD